MNHQEDSTEIDNDVNEDEDINYNEGTSQCLREVVRERSFELENETLQRLKENDPDVTHLNIPLLHYKQDGECFFDSINWKEDDECIANNTQLKKITMTYKGRTWGLTLGERYNRPTGRQLEDFFSCIYRNRSIVSLETNSINFTDDFAGILIEGLSGHPSLERLKIGNDSYSLGIGSICYKALENVLKHPRSKLKKLSIPNSKLDDNGLGIVCDGLLGNSRITSLCLDNNEHITSVGWQALSTVLQHCNLIELGLFNTGINDDTAVILGTGLRGSSLKVLNLGDNRSIKSAGWQTLFNQLSKTSIESLDLDRSDISDDSISVLANVTTLKSLILSMNISLTPEGWRSLFNSLQTRRIQLKKLDISYSKIGNVGIAALGSLVNSMGKLKTLKMNSISRRFGGSDGNITSQGWVSFFMSLQDSNLDLVNLNLCGSTIHDNGMQLLVRLVSNMGSLKYLNLGNNEFVTPTGWQALTGFFESPKFVLENIDLFNIRLSEDTVTALTRALAGNKTLKRLVLEECRDEDYIEIMTERGWDAVSTILCNKTSILGTYTSNHTLQYIRGDNYIDLPDCLMSYLKLNENKDKVEVARQKILQTHFSGSGNDDKSNIQVLLDMELQMMPTAIDWIGRPTHNDWRGTTVSGLSLLYNLMRRLPDLFDSSPQKKRSMGKRKRRECSTKA